MTCSSRMLSSFLLLCLLLPLSGFSAEDEAEEEPALFTSEQLAALISDEEGLIGGVISPLSGNPCLRQRDFTVMGAQEISLSRVYVSPYMRHKFNKHYDADCYYRRLYLMRHYEGWKFFPHQRLWFNGATQEVHVIHPSAAAYDFSLADAKTTLLHSYAVSNTSGSALPSGQFDPRNTRISRDPTGFNVFSPDGSTRHYRQKLGRGFLLDKEILPNGKVLRYRYTDSGLSLVESLDPKERYVYASIQVQGSPWAGNCTFTSSTGLNASYTFDRQHVHGKFCDDSRKMEYNFILPPMLTQVSSPQYRGETSVHNNPNCLLQSFSGKEEIFTLSQARCGERGAVHLRVDNLFLPVGTNDSLVPVYQMSYEPAVAGKKEGKTTVKNCDGTSTVYHFSKNLLTTLIQYFGTDGSLKREKAFSWNDKNWLQAVELREGDHHLLLRKSYEYDRFGNPTSEIFVGDLTGEGGEDHYTIKRMFSQDGRHLLLREETEEGKITTFNYLPNTNLVRFKVTKGGGRFLRVECFQYDDCHNLIGKSIGDGKKQQAITEYILRQQQPFLHMPEWVEEKCLENGIEVLLKRIHLDYDQWGNVREERIYDAHGDYAYSITREYNERGDLLSETNPLGQKQTFSYDERGRRCTSTNFSGRLHEQRQYDQRHRLRKQIATGIDSVEETNTYTYDDNDNLIQKVDTYGNSFSYTIDPLAHKPTKTTSPSILNAEGSATPVVETSTYDAWGREISKTDANGNTTSYRYNSYDSPIEVTYPNGGKESYRYTKGGQKSSYTDPDGLTIYYTHDVLNRVIAKNYGKNLGKENFFYDSFNLLEENDLEGNITHYRYDGSGRKTYEETSGRVTTFGYDPLGRLAEIKKEGLKTSLKRDLVDRLIEETKTDADNHPLYKVSFAHDNDGNLNKITRYIDGKESVESFVFDAFSREILHCDPLGHKTTIVYNENHINELGQKVLQITTVDPLGISTIKTHDPYSRDVQEEKLNSQGSTISCWRKHYDPCGNLTDWKDHLYEGTQLQGIQIAHFNYTADNKVKSSTRAFGTSKERITHYTYTPGGRTETKTLPDETVLTYAHTPLGYLERVCSSDNKIQHRFECNKKGELLRFFDEKENISIQREVDPFGNVTRESFPNHIEVTKTYDPFDRLLTLQITDIGQVSFNYDPLYLRDVSRFSKDGKLQYKHFYENYDLDGNLLSESMISHSGKIQHHIDLKGRKTEIASPYFSQKCVYDAVDNLTKNIVDQQSLSYAYDDLFQLTGESDTLYAYDSLFNRRMKDGIEYTINTLNELNELTYDLNGNQVQKGQIHYIYDPLNRLIEATLDTRKICFQYDPLDRRLSKTVLSKSSSDWEETYREYYLYDGKNEIGAVASDGTLKNLKVMALMYKQLPTREALENNNVEEIDQIEGKQNNRFHADFLIDLIIPATVAVELDQKVYVPLMDVQKNICRLVDPLSKKIVSRYDFSAFGEEQKAQVDENPWRFAAKRFDPELNLIYFGKRYYDPELGRWLAIDPAGFVDNLNLYQYDLNNPFRYYDPDGELAFLIPFAIPFAQFLCGTAIASVIVDAVIVSAVAVATWEGAQYVSNVMEKKSNQGTKGSHSSVRPSTADVHDKAEKRRGREQRNADAKRQKIKNKAKNKKQQNRGKNKKWG